MRCRFSIVETIVEHVIFRDGLEDRDYLERYTIGAAELRERVREWTPARAAQATGPAGRGRIEAFAREYATTQPSAIRLNYGLNRHAGAGMAVRTIACLPASRAPGGTPGGGLLLSSSGTFPVDNDALERPDLVPAGHAHAQHERARPRCSTRRWTRR